MASPQGFRRNGPAHVAGPLSVEEVAERAARLGITPERVLEEYSRIAFTNLGDIVTWDAGGMALKEDADTAAIIEIVASAGKGRPYRIKLHDKKPFLDAIARYLGMFPSTQAGQHEDPQTDDIEANEELERRLARLAASADKKGVSAVAAVEPGGAL
jgi:hypothetical protein